MGLLSSLFRPKTLIDAVRARKVEIKGFFVLFMTAMLTFFTMLPVLAILIAKLAFVLEHPIGQAVKKAVLLSAVLLLLIPFTKWWMQSVLIHGFLRTKREELERPKFSIVLLGRSFGLIPMIMLIPLKVLLISPQYLIQHIFFPPISALCLTWMDGWMGLPKGMPWDLFVLSRPTPGIRPSFWISAGFVFLTYILTVRKIRSLSDLPKGFLYVRVLGAVLLWDVLSMVVLLMAPKLV